MSPRLLSTVRSNANLPFLLRVFAVNQDSLAGRFPPPEIYPDPGGPFGPKCNPCLRNVLLLMSRQTTFFAQQKFGFDTWFLGVASIDVCWREIAPDDAGFDRPKIIVEQRLQAQAPEPAIRKLQAVDVLVLREHGVRADKWQKSVKYAATFGFGHEA